jgi:hypothetical protein
MFKVLIFPFNIKNIWLIAQKYKNIKPNCTKKTWMMKDPKGTPCQSWSLSLNIESQQHFDGCKQLPS